MASPKEKLALERAHAFLAAKLQEQAITDGTLSPNFNKFVEETTAAANAHFLSVPPEVKAKIIEDANSEAMMAWLRAHKELMRRLKTDASDPRKLVETDEPVRRTAEESRAAAQARFEASRAMDRKADRNMRKGVVDDKTALSQLIRGPKQSNRAKRREKQEGRIHIGGEEHAIDVLQMHDKFHS
jgi:hypothetical protein